MSNSAVNLLGQADTICQGYGDSNLASTSNTSELQLLGEEVLRKDKQEQLTLESISENDSLEEVIQRKADHEQLNMFELFDEQKSEQKNIYDHEQLEKQQEQEEEEEEKQLEVAENNEEFENDNENNDDDGQYSSDHSELEDLFTEMIEELLTDVFQGQEASLEFSLNAFKQNLKSIKDHPNILENVKKAFFKGYYRGTTIAYILAVELYNHLPHELPYLLGSLLKICKQKRINIFMFFEEVVEVLIDQCHYSHIHRLAQFMEGCLENEKFQPYLNLDLS